LAECTGYYWYASVCFENSTTVEQWVEKRDDAWSKAIVAHELLGIDSAADIVKTRMDKVFTELYEQSKKNSEERGDPLCPIVVLKASQGRFIECSEAVKDPEARLLYWINKQD